MFPVIALVGRPNVGKSTLFNRLTRSRNALVANFEGVTRDRIYKKGQVGDYKCIFIDTGGLCSDCEKLDDKTANLAVANQLSHQAWQAVDEADVVFFLVDAKAGVTPEDELLSLQIRKSSKKTYLLINKSDSENTDLPLAEFSLLGMSNMRCISAKNGNGFASLISELASVFDVQGYDVKYKDGNDSGVENHTVKISIVGRPNVGKSTLVNRMLGEERVIVYDEGGTTRDSVYIPHESNGRLYTLIDTAGVRRRGKVSESIEKLSIIKTLQAMNSSNVVIVLVDARTGLVDQDLHVLSYAVDSGRGLVIAINKWDGLSISERQEVKSEIERKLSFAKFARVHFISALNGSGVRGIYRSIDESYSASMGRWSTGYLTRILNTAVTKHQPPMIRGRRIKLNYCHMGGNNPPVFVVHGNQTDQLPATYQRYLINAYREVLELQGTNVVFQFKTSNNPYKDKVNKLNVRQIKKKQRLVTHVKKKEYKAKRQRSSIQY